MFPNMFRGMTVSKNLCSFNWRIRRSTCTLRCAMDWVSLTSCTGIWGLPARKAGLYTLQGTQSPTRKPLSTMIAISGVSRVSIPDSTNICLLLTYQERNEGYRIMGGHGNHSLQGAVGLVWLYEEYTSLWSKGDVGVWHLSSVQSRITVVSG